MVAVPAIEAVGVGRMARILLAIAVQTPVLVVSLKITEPL